MAQVISTQQTVNNNAGAGFGQWANVRYRGQVFTATQSSISALLFYCQFDGGGSHIGFKVTIANVNQTTNLPMTDIYSFTIAYNQYTQNKYNRFTLPAAVTGLSVGTKYCIYFAPWNTSTNAYADYYRDLKWSNSDADYAGKAIRNDNGTWSVESNLQLYFQLFYDYTLPTFTPSYTQPALPTPTSGWNINAVDAQITTKNWNQDATKCANEVAAMKALGANYISIACPLDNPTYYKRWCDAIHNAGLKVYHRAHFNGWEGDNGYTVHVDGTEYQARFYKFVLDNASCFQSGDMVAMCCEANRADNAGNQVFRTSGSFDYSKYNTFMKNQVAIANKAFTDASITGVHTWGVSHSLSNLNLNGQFLDSGDGGNINGLTDSDITTYFAGRLSIDHYLSDTYRQASKYWLKYGSDMDKIHTAFPNAKLMLSEWGYHTTTTTTDDEQYAVYDGVLTQLRLKDYIVGFSAWNHMGQAQSSLFTDASGSIVTPGRPAVNAITRAFTSYNAARGW